MKYKLFKRASVIHVVKCNKSADFNQGVTSYQKLQNIISSIEDANEERLKDIENEIENWKNSNPIASDAEIKKILK